MKKNLHIYVVEKLIACRGRWNAIAEATGISKRTIEKIAREEIADPGIMKIQQLADYFMKRKIK